MTWRHFETTIEGKRAQLLLNDDFAANPPKDALPKLGWFGVWCRMDPRGALWHPEEAAALDALETALLEAVEKHANGWAVHVCRLSTAGLREYYFPHGSGASLEKVVDALKRSHPDYRVEFDSTPDPTWSQYARWLAAAPKP